MIKFFVVLQFYQIVFGSPLKDYEFLNATQTESPWLAYLMILGEPCGGSLINDQYIVAAAHCFDKVKKDHYTNEDGKLEEAVKIKLGEWKTDRDPDCEPGVEGEICDYVVEIPPNELKVHERYKQNTGKGRFKNDIAILQLTWPPRKSQLIDSITLPEDDECYDEVEDEIWTVTGFGQKPDKEYATVKKKIDIRMISHEECEDSINDQKPYYDRTTHVCGKGTRGESTCVGDSGSGVTFNSTHGPTLEGIVSFGVSECGTVGAASGFVRVACFLDWINEKIEEWEEDQYSAKKQEVSTTRASYLSFNILNVFHSGLNIFKFFSGF